jgi:hypothetical protein
MTSYGITFMVGPAVPPPVPKLGREVGAPAVGELAVGMTVSSIKSVVGFVVVSADGETVSAEALPDGALDGESAKILSDGPTVGVATVSFADGVAVGDGNMVERAPTSTTVQFHLATGKTLVPFELTKTSSARRVSTVF